MAAVWNAESLKTKQNYSSQNTWNHSQNSGSSQERMQNYVGESNENIKYFLSRNLLNTKGTQW